MEDSQIIIWPRKVASQILDDAAYTTLAEMQDAVCVSAPPELWDWINILIEAGWRNTLTEAQAHFERITNLRSLDERRKELYALPVRVRELVKEKLNHEWKSRTKLKTVSRLDRT